MRSSHLEAKEKGRLIGEEDLFVLDGLERSIESYEEEKKRYEEEFKRLSKKHKSIRNLMSVPGLGLINSVRVLARVVDPSVLRQRSLVELLWPCKASQDEWRTFLWEEKSKVL